MPNINKKAETNTCTHTAQFFKFISQQSIKLRENYATLFSIILSISEWFTRQDPGNVVHYNGGK